MIDIILGVMIWREFPTSALTIIGVLVGISFIFRGVSWLMVSGFRKWLLDLSSTEEANPLTRRCVSSRIAVPETRSSGVTLSPRSRTNAMSNTVGSEVQDLEFAQQADLSWLARLDECQRRTNPLSFGYGLW